jgi:hypothetical protein
MSENGSCACYFVEELIGGMQEGAWIDSSTIEILRGGNIPEPCAQKPAITALRGTGTRGWTHANTDERKLSSLQTQLEPLVALLHGFIIGSRNTACEAVIGNPVSADANSESFEIISL